MALRRSIDLEGLTRNPQVKESFLHLTRRRPRQVLFVVETVLGFLLGEKLAQAAKPQILTRIATIRFTRGAEA